MEQVLCLELALLVGDGALVCLAGAWICGSCLGSILLTVDSIREWTLDLAVCVDSVLVC